MAGTDCRPLLDPASVAIVGASSSPAKPGHILLRNILDGGFAGRVFPVNPGASEIAGRECYSSIAAIPGSVDLVFIVLGRERVLPAVLECADAGVEAVCIITAGFGEGDEWGKQQELELRELVRSTGMVAIGPNTIGTVSMGGALRGTFVPFPHWESGSVALVAQTGIFAGAVMREHMDQPSQRIGFKASVDIGNRVGVDELDLLQAFAEDGEIGVIGFYLESFANARAFLREASVVKREKPIVVLKPGRTREGAAASASHTGSLGQDDAVVDQLLAQHGIVRADDEREFLACLKAFSYAPLPAGPRVGVITYSGALGVIATDQIVAAGLEVAEIDPATAAAIEELMPDWQRAGNPSDMWSAVELDAVATARVGFGAMLEDGNIDQVLGVMLAVPNADFEEFGEVFAELRHGSAKPLHLVMPGPQKARWTAALEGLRIPVYDSSREAVRAMAAMTRYVAARDRVPAAHSVQ
jgi:acetyltransferase